MHAKVADANFCFLLWTPRLRISTLHTPLFFCKKSETGQPTEPSHGLVDTPPSLLLRVTPPPPLPPFAAQSLLLTTKTETRPFFSLFQRGHMPWQRCALFFCGLRLPTVRVPLLWSQTFFSDRSGRLSSSNQEPRVSHTMILREYLLLGLARTTVGRTAQASAFVM